MKNNRKPNKFLFLCAQFLAGAAAGLGFIVLLFSSMPQVLALPPLAYALALVGCAAWMLLTAWMHILLHEAGHLLGGLCSGYRFVSYRVGKTIWMRRDGRLVRGRYTVAGTGGQCLMAPPGSPYGPFPYILYNAAGGLANLAAGALLALAGLACPPSLPRFLLLGAALTSGVTAVLNLLPMGGNDGANIASLRRSEDARRALWVTLAANAFLTEGGAARALPADWLAFPPPDSDTEALVLGVHALRAEKLLDDGDLSGAAALTRLLLDSCPRLWPVQKSELQCQLLLLTLILDGPGPDANALCGPALQKYIRATAGYPARQCLLYALAVLRDGDGTAARRARAALAAIGPEYPHPAEIEQCLGLARRIDEAARVRDGQSKADECAAEMPRI